MDLILVRHAEPVRVDAVAGAQPADPHLTPAGRAKAALVGRWLAHEGVDHVATSPLTRARETADPIASSLGVEPEVVEGIGEFDRRDASYIPFEELPRDHERFSAMVEGRWTDVEGWTDPETFRNDAVGAIESLVERFPGGRVAVFTHAGVLNVYLGHVLGIPRSLWFYPGYASVSRVAAARSGERGVISVNETAHLQPDRLAVHLEAGGGAPGGGPPRAGQPQPGAAA